MRKAGIIHATGSGQAEFFLPYEPAFVEVEFIDGLNDSNDMGCGNIQIDQVSVSVRTEHTEVDRHKHWYLIVTWTIFKPRTIKWLARRKVWTG